MADEEGEQEEVPATSLTMDIAAGGLSMLKDVGANGQAGTLSFNYTRLELAGRNLIDLQDLHKYPALRLLDVCNNQIADAAQVGKLQGLLSAKLDGNKLASLDGLSSLEHLQLLSAKSNAITSIETLSLSKLKFLSLDGNQLTSLPLSACTNLTVLEARDNKLTSTAGIEGLENLEELHLARNEITELRLGPMPCLRVLAMPTNQVATLSAFCGENDVANAPNLEQLDMSTNTVASAKEFASLAGLKQLKSLTLAESPASAVDKYRNHIHGVLPDLATLEGESFAEEDLEPPPPIEEEPVEG